MGEGTLAPCPPFKHKYRQDGKHAEPVIGRSVRSDPLALPSPGLSCRRFFMRNFSILVSAAALFAALTGAVAQQPMQPMQRVQIGILECRGAASVGFIVGSVTNLGCVFRSDSVPEDRSDVAIRTVGLDRRIAQA